MVAEPSQYSSDFGHSFKMKINEISLYFNGLRFHLSILPKSNYLPLCCFTGLTFYDVDKLREHNIEVLENGKRLMKIYIPLSNKVREIPLLTIPCLILDKYKGKQPDGKLLPLSCNAALNHNLKEIARLYGINRDLTFHLARYTFIGTVTVANGISLKTVADILGHTQLNCIRSFIEPTNDKVQEDMAILSGKFRKIEKMFNI